MNEKLLEYFKSDDIHLIECEHKWCDAYGYEKSQMKKDLLDYITNLQQENERLKQFLFESINNTNKGIELIEIYRLRCEKTTNYYLKTLAKNGSMPDEAVEMFNLLEGNK